MTYMLNSRSNVDMSYGSLKESLRVPTERLQVFRMKGTCFACQLLVCFFIWTEYASARDPAQRRFVRPSTDKTDDAMNCNRNTISLCSACIVAQVQCNLTASFYGSLPIVLQS